MLAEKLYNLNSFQKQYRAILILSVCKTIIDLEWNYDRQELLEEIDWNNIIGIASVLSHTEENKYLDAALRIAQATIMENSTSSLQKEASAVILLSLTNKPAVLLAIKRGLLSPDFEEHLPLTLKIQNKKVQFENSILLDNKILNLNRFQSKVYQSFNSNDAISISAPTSAGKSFILCNLIIDELLKSNKNIVYLVPTRALISQVEFDLRELAKVNGVQSFNISTVPHDEQIISGSNIWVFTQERLHWFLIENSDVDIDMIVVDEAHKIEDSYRGILLQQKLEEVVSMNPLVKVVFSSPFTSNPEILLENVKRDSKKEKINTQFVAVNQNLIYATQVPRKTDKWELSLCLINENINLGTIKLVDRPTTELKKMAYLSIAFSSNAQGNIIYANGAAQAEEIALLLSSTLQEESDEDEIEDIIKLVKKTVHKEYRLAKVLKKKIAFHYGNMPLLIRQEIERLFKDGKIKYLICTSTLLEGVNLPAKSIFIRKPNRGSGSPLNQNDFWNLAGRAGRWGIEFSGNIVCIEPTRWDIQPNPNKHKQKIIRAIDIVNDNRNDLFKYIKEKSPRKEADLKQALEFAFGYYYIQYIDGKLSPSIELQNSLIELFQEVKQFVQLPDYIIKRNPGISPIAQQQLFNYFSDNLDRIDELIPVYPEDENAYEDYMKLIGRIGKTLAFYPPQINSPRAILLINWMSGKPLSYIIKKTYDSYQSREKYQNKTLHSVIREVMESVENFARFRFAKDSSAYVDILRYFLELHNKLDLIEYIPQLNLWLEFGVSQKTHISLLSLGLTRNTVVELTNYIPDSNMSKEEANAWLRSQDLNQLELSPIIYDDILTKLQMN